LAWEGYVSGDYEIFYANKKPGKSWSTPLNVSRNAGESTHPRMAVDTVGNAYLVWRDGSPGQMDVFYTARAPDGTWRPLQNVHSSDQMAGTPVIAVDSEHSLHLMWTEKGVLLYSHKARGGIWSQPEEGPATIRVAGALELAIQENVLHLAWVDGTGAQTEIGYARKGPGRSWSLPWNITQDPAYSQYGQMLIDDQDTVHVIWDDNQQGNFEIMYQYKPSEGVWSTPENISHNSGNSTDPATLLDRTGTLHAVWEDDTGGQTQINYAYKLSGGGWTAPVAISRADAPAEQPALTIDGSHTLHVVWKGLASGNYEILYACKWPGGGWSAPLNISTNAGHSAEPAIVADQADILHVVWTDSTLGNHEILYAWRLPTGTWASPENLSNNSSYSAEPFIALGHEGQLHLLWRDNVAGPFDIYYIVKRTSGWSEAINISQTAGVSGAPLILPASDGSLHVFWEDQTPGHYEIFYAHRRLPGPWTKGIDISNTPNNSTAPAGALDKDADPRVLWQEETSGGHDLFYSIRLNAPPYGPLDPQVEGKSNPTGVADLTPEFSWTFFDPDHGDIQSHYRLWVSSTPEHLAQDIGDLWDSGKVYSPQSTKLAYAGAPLNWATTYYWKVKTWDNNDLEGNETLPQAFTTSLFPKAPLTLRCQGKDTPQRLTTQTPVFSWSFSDEDKGDRQGSYRLLVASHPALLLDETGDMWDSAKIDGTQQVDIVYDGATLEWGETYYWTVKTWDENDLEGPYAEPHAFRLMALPDPPHEPQCDEQVNPSALINLAPAFSWRFDDDDPGDYQTAYRLLVASSIENLNADIGDLWDTGKIVGDASEGITYNGQALAWSKAYCWKVCTWDELDAQGPYCPAQFFTTNAFPEAPTYLECDPTTAHPMFSWAFTDPNPDDTQSAYHLLVASSEILLDADLGDMWDSGQVTSTQSSGILYQGEPLARRKTYYWKVRTWDANGFPGPFCGTRVFTLDTAPHPPAHLLCEGQSSPRGIPDKTPEFSWTFADPDPGDQQGGYRLLVASSQANLEADIGDMWDSGQVASSLADDIPYEGHPLFWKKRYYWKVQTWDRLGAASEFSAIQTFTMNAPPNRPESPLCEGRKNPGAIQAPYPKLSWTFVDNDLGDTQSAYQILVASSMEALAEDTGDIWDSGKVVSPETEGVVYAGAPLTPATTYYWKVRCWDEHGLESHYSASQEFTTQTPMLELKTGYMGGVCPGWDQHYFLTIENTALRPLFNVRLVYDLPERVHFYDADQGGQYDPTKGQVVWTLGNMAQYQVRQLWLTLHISSAAQPGSRLGHRITVLAQGTAYDKLEYGELVRDCSQLPTAVPSPTPTQTKRPTATPTLRHTPGHEPTRTPTPAATSASLGEISGLVWEDQNRNGAWEPPEPPLSGMTLILDPRGDGVTQSEGKTLFSSTGPDGTYCFSDLLAGTYILILSQRRGYYATTQNIAELTLTAGRTQVCDFGIASFLKNHLPRLSTGLGNSG
jgi:hypothetical protein